MVAEEQSTHRAALAAINARDPRALRSELVDGVDFRVVFIGHINFLEHIKCHRSKCAALHWFCAAILRRSEGVERAASRAAREITVIGLRLRSPDRVDVDAAFRDLGELLIRGLFFCQRALQ